jgi:hypothetical protein
MKKVCFLYIRGAFRAQQGFTSGQRFFTTWSKWSFPRPAWGFKKRPFFFRGAFRVPLAPKG